MAALQPAGEDIFPDGHCHGFYSTDSNELGQSSVTLVDSDVVCIRSRPNDGGGRHNALREPGLAGTRRSPTAYILPPFSTVTLLSVQHKWKVRRQTMHCRLFTVEITYDVW